MASSEDLAEKLYTLGTSVEIRLPKMFTSADWEQDERDCCLISSLCTVLPWCGKDAQKTTGHEDL